MADAHGVRARGGAPKSAVVCLNWMLLSVLGYVAMQLAIGFVVSRRVKTESDYLLAGRSLGLRLSVFTVFATWFGAETCIGATAQAYRSGLAGVTADPFGYAGCLVLMGAFLAVPLWQRKLTTLADLFRERFGTTSERMVALLLVPTSVMWAGAQIRAFGQVLGATSELALTTTITIAAAVVIIYTSLGGMLADAVSDFVQGIILLVGLTFLLLAMLQSGDVAQVWSQTELSWREPHATPLSTLETWAVPLFGSLMAQELVGRVVAARTPTIARRGTLIAAVLYLAVGSIPVLVGLVAARVAPGIEHSERVLVMQAAHYLPRVGHVIFLGALVSAILSTVDSALLAAGSLSAHNLILPLLPSLGEKRKLAINRAAVVVFGLLAYGLALSTHGVYGLVEEASAFGTAGVFVCVLFGLFTRIGGPSAALTSITLGFVVYLLGKHVWSWSCPYLASLCAALLGFGIAAILEQVHRRALVRAAAKASRTNEVS